MWRSSPFVTRSLTVLLGMWSIAIAPPLRAQTDEVGSLADTVTRLHGAGRYNDALPLALRVMALSKERYGADSAQYANALNAVGRIQLVFNRSVEAEAACATSLSIREKALPEGHPDIAQSLICLGAAYGSKAKFAEGEAMLNRALAIQQRALPDGHADTAKTLLNLAALHHAQGRTAEAETLARKAVQDFEKQLGPDHAFVGYAITMQANLHLAQGRPQDAEPLIKQALRIQAKRLPDAYHDYSLALGFLTQFYTSQGRHAETEAALKDAVSESERVRPAGHPDIARRLLQLAGHYFGQNRQAEALPLVTRALSMFGTNDPGGQEYAAALFVWAMLLDWKRDYANSEPFFRQLLPIYEKSTPPSPPFPDAITFFQVMAMHYFFQGKFAESEPFLRRSLALAEKKGGGHETMPMSLSTLAVVRHFQGRDADSEQLFKRAIATSERLGDAGTSDLMLALLGLGGTYESMGRLAEAEPIYRKLLGLREKVLGPQHSDVAETRHTLGSLYKSLGRLAEAEALLNLALATRESVLGAQHPAVASSLTQLGDLYRIQGLCDKAEPLFLRAREIRDAGIQEVPVFFGTDRKQDAKSAAVTFGGERGAATSLGLAIVTIHKERAIEPSSLQAAPTSLDAVSAPKPVLPETRRLSLHCIELVNDKKMVEAAVRRLIASRTYSRQILVFVHGYNVSFENAVRRAAQIAYDIKFDGGVFMFSWPSRERLMDYFSDRETVDIAAEHLREFLEKVVAEAAPEKVHFLAHSIGNMVLLRALEKLGNDGSRISSVVGEIIDAAPDVDPDLFVQMVNRIKSKGGNLTLYASQSDKALWLSSWLRDRPRAGFIHDEPLVVSGVDTIDITAATANWFALNHDVYANSPVIVEDIRRLILTSERPPQQRTNAYDAVRTKDGRTYWRLRP
jgi:esterase/lipase superfamily enzyme/tetratricopeptide (TPR) repeat protein